MIEQTKTILEPLWIDPFTGEILDHKAPDFDPSLGLLIEGPHPDDPSPEEAELEDIGDYLSRQYTLIDAEISALKTQFERRVSALNGRRKYLAYRYEQQFERLLHLDLEGGKKKSRDFSHGRAGFRTSKRVEIKDEQAALGWAAMNCTEAIRKSVSLIKSKLPKDMVEEGGVPGVERVETTNFYLQPAKDRK